MNKIENMQEFSSGRNEGALIGSVMEMPLKGLGTYLTITALGFIVVLVLGAVFDALTGTPVGTVSEQLTSLTTKSTFYNLARLCDAFIPLFFFALTAGVGLFVQTASSRMYLSRIGVLFLSVYAPISVVVYVAQYTLLSLMLKDASTRSALWPLWSLVVPAMSYLAYAIGAIGEMLIGIGLIGERDARRWAGWSLLLMGGIFLLAFVVQVTSGFGLALPLLWAGGLAGVSFAVAIIISTRRSERLVNETRH